MWSLRLPLPSCGDRDEAGRVSRLPAYEACTCPERPQLTSAGVGKESRTITSAACGPSLEPGAR